MFLPATELLLPSPQERFSYGTSIAGEEYSQNGVAARPDR